jgi:dihydroorotate dehydrogenase|nr:MAG TPA: PHOSPHATIDYLINOSITOL 4-KINASE BETA [Caudoviricetes sp.]
MNKSKIQQQTRQLKSYIDDIELEVSRPNPNYMYVQSKVNVLPMLIKELQKELEK